MARTKQLPKRPNEPEKTRDTAKDRKPIKFCMDEQHVYELNKFLSACATGIQEGVLNYEAAYKRLNMFVVSNLKQVTSEDEKE